MSRPEGQLTEKGQIAHGGGIDYGGQGVVRRGKNLKDVIKGFVPDELQGIPGGEQFYEDPVRNLFIISHSVRDRVQYCKSFQLSEELNGGVVDAKTIWDKREGNCQAYSILFASILGGLGVRCRLISLVSSDTKHPPHMVVLVHFPPDHKLNGYSKKCTQLWKTGVDGVAEGFKLKTGRVLRWIHVSARSKAHTKDGVEIGHWLLHPPQQVLGGYYGLFKAQYIMPKSRDSEGGFRFATQVKVRWQSPEEPLADTPDVTQDAAWQCEEAPSAIDEVEDEEQQQEHHHQRILADSLVMATSSFRSNTKGCEDRLPGGLVPDGAIGWILKFNDKGSAYIDFFSLGKHWVRAANLGKLRAVGGGEGDDVDVDEEEENEEILEDEWVDGEEAAHT